DSVPADERAEWVMNRPLDGTWVVLCLLGGVSAFVASSVLGRRESVRYTRGLAVVALSALGLAALIGRDLSWVTDGGPQGYERLMQLFIYNYERPWPDYLDYRPVLTGFAIVAATMTGLLAIPQVRR